MIRYTILNALGVCIYFSLILMHKDYASLFGNHLGGEGLVLMIIPLLITPCLISIGIFKLLLFKRKKIAMKGTKVLNAFGFFLTPLILTGLVFSNVAGIDNFIVILSGICSINISIEWMMFKKESDRVH